MMVEQMEWKYKGKPYRTNNQHYSNIKSKYHTRVKKVEGLKTQYVKGQEGSFVVCMSICVTPPNSEIICVQNVGTKVVCGIIFFFEKKAMLKI